MSRVARFFPTGWSGRMTAGVAATVLLWLSLLIFPYAPETYLDASWQETLIHVHTQNRQFGRELIFTWGPWGYLFSLFHLGDAASTGRLVWELGGKLLVAGGLVLATASLRPGRQAAVLTVSLLGLHYFQDCAYLLLISAGTIALARAPRVPVGGLIAIAVLAAFLAQVKFTYALLIAVGVGVTACVYGRERRWREAAGFVGACLLSFVAWWLAAGQNPDHIWPYFLRSWEISTGYAHAMSLEEPMPVFLCGLATILGFAVFLGAQVRRHWRDQRVLGPAAFAAAALFLAWKHGFTRADGHVLGFFLFVLPFGLVLGGSFPAQRRWVWLDLTVIPIVAGLWVFEPGLPARLPAATWHRVQVNFSGVLATPHLPAAWQAAYQGARDHYALPQIRARVGQATVDVFNFEQGYALLNGLNFTPRPIFQGYSTYTPGLAHWNLRYYQSPDAPRFILWKQDSIDARFPTTDDAPLYPYLAARYDPVMEETGFLLLERRELPDSTPPTRQLVFQRGASLGETVSLPIIPEQAAWLRVVMHPTKIGRLRSALYKPHPVQLTVIETSGRRTTWRLLPVVSTDGFLVHPFIEAQGDFAAFLRGHGRKQIQAVQIDAPGGEEFWHRAEILLDTLPGVPVDSTAAHDDFVTRGVANLAPSRIEAGLPLEHFAGSTGPAVQCHAPSRLTFDPPTGVTRLRATFGLRPGAYDNGAHTDGVVFRVTAITGEEERVLWSRRLQPTTVDSDRGPQTVDLTFPAGAPLVLETGNGPEQDTRWDWSYWAGLKFD